MVAIVLYCELRAFALSWHVLHKEPSIALTNSMKWGLITEITDSMLGCICSDFPPTPATLLFLVLFIQSFLGSLPLFPICHFHFACIAGCLLLYISTRLPWLEQIKLILRSVLFQPIHPDIDWNRYASYSHTHKWKAVQWRTRERGREREYKMLHIVGLNSDHFVCLNLTLFSDNSDWWKKCLSFLFIPKFLHIFSYAMWK